MEYLAQGIGQWNGEVGISKLHRCQRCRISIHGKRRPAASSLYLLAGTSKAHGEGIACGGMLALRTPRATSRFRLGPRAAQAMGLSHWAREIAS